MLEGVGQVGMVAVSRVFVLVACLFEGGEEGLLKLTVVIAAELCKYTRNHQTIAQTCKLDGI